LCSIDIGGSGGVLGVDSTWQMDVGVALTLPGPRIYDETTGPPPEGQALLPNETLTWDSYDDKTTWEICFARV
jgi:hypothetical protein